jgi:hypothetical protein
MNVCLHFQVPDSGGHPHTQQQQVQSVQSGSVATAMDVQMQRHPPPPSSGPATSTATAAPFQYFLHEQARSLVALQVSISCMFMHRISFIIKLICNRQHFNP